MKEVFSLRHWLEQVNESGLLKTVSGADVKHEIGAITEINVTTGQHVLRFEDIPGFDKQFSVLSGVVLKPKTLNFALNITNGSDDKVENASIISNALRIAQENAAQYPIRYVQTGPVMENIQTGEDVDVSIFPNPIWHEGDGGPYITGGVQIHQDPEGGCVNIGCYRMHILDKKNIGNYIVKSNHGNVIREKYWAQGKPAPVVILGGMHPVFFVLGGTAMDANTSEIQVAGALFGESVPVIKGPVTGLPIPADAEIAMEGWVYPDEKRSEGELAEYTGYYGGGVSMQPFVKVAAVYYRNGASILGALPGKPPHDFSYMSATMKAAAVKEQLAKAGIPGVKGVYALEAGSASIYVTSIKQMYPGHANQALLISTGCRAGSLTARYSIVVDEDIDPSSPNQVLWALGWRTDPKEDIDIVRQVVSLGLDPMQTKQAKETGNTVTSRALINACIPYDRLGSFSKPADVSSALMKATKEKWAHLWK